MEWFRRKLKKCKHEYKYYNSSKTYSGWSALHFTQYHFVCTKCEEVVFISERDISETVEKLGEDYAKRRALGKTEKVDSDTFTLGRINNIGICYQSVGAKLAIDYYAKQGIPIKDLHLCK